MGSFWEVDRFKDDFSEEEKTLKNSGFNRFLPVFLPKVAVFWQFLAQKLPDFPSPILPLTPSFVGSNPATPANLRVAIII